MIIDPSSQQEFSDADFRIVDNADQSKKLAFQVSGITTATTRTWTVPDADVLIESGTFTPTITFGGNSAGQTYAAGERSGIYYRFGPVVLWAFRARFSAKGSSTGNAGFSGLPYAANAYTTNGAFPGSIWSLASFSGLTGTLSCGVIGGGATGTFRMSSATGDGVVSDTFFTNSTAVNMGGWYYV